MSPRIIIHVNSRLVLPSCPPALRKLLVSSFEYANPDVAEARKAGRNAWHLPTKIQTWRDEPADGGGTHLSLPRGGTGKLRVALKQVGLVPDWRDERVQHDPIAFPKFQLVLRDYQEAAVLACLKREQGLIRAGTGSGKTVAALAFISRAQQPALVIMRDSNLLKQWSDRVESQMGMPKKQIGVLAGGKRKVGTRITLALQQTLNAETFPFDEVVGLFGTIVVDETQGVASRTFQNVVDRFAAKYRIGFSADARRRDGKEFLTYDCMGHVIHETSRADLEASGAIVPVDVHAVETGMRDSAWERGDRDMTRMQGMIADDVARNELVLSCVRLLLANRRGPAFVFVNRREHAKWLADTLLYDAGIRCGLLLGGANDADRFAEDRERLEAGQLDVAVGTFNAIGQGIDIPLVRSAVVVSPIGANEQFFGQVRGRVCRPSPGKAVGDLVYLWDSHLFPRQFDRMAEWSGGRCRQTTVDRLFA